MKRWTCCSHCSPKRQWFQRVLEAQLWRMDLAVRALLPISHFHISSHPEIQSIHRQSSFEVEGYGWKLRGKVILSYTYLCGCLCFDEPRLHADDSDGSAVLKDTEECTGISLHKVDVMSSSPLLLATETGSSLRRPLSMEVLPQVGPNISQPAEIQSG